MEFNKEKFKSLVHYICHRADVKELGAVKLNKILWYADSISYLVTEKSLTGETYKKDKFGPIPQHILQSLEELENSNVIKRDTSDHHDYRKTDYHCLIKPSADLLSSEETEFIDELIGIICKKHTAVSISQLTHDRIWELAESGEEIPLYTVFASKIKEPSEAALNWAASVFAE